MGNLLNIFSPYDKNRPLWVIGRAGKRPEITVKRFQQLKDFANNHSGSVSENFKAKVKSDFAGK